MTQSLTPPEPGSGARAVLPPSPAFRGSLSDVARDFVARLHEEIAESLWAGATGAAISERVTQATDELIRLIVEVTTERYGQRYARGSQQRCAVIAQGGYGRCEMSPWSDVDVLIFHAGRLSSYVETVNERLMQTLFDAGLQVGWAVRTARQCLDEAERDITIRTALLDGRFVAGSPELGAQFTEGVQDILASRAVDAFVAEKLAEVEQRRARYGSSVFLLEPNVKEGQGGLRDLQTVLWIARVKRGVVRLEELVDAGVATASQLSDLLEARDFLLRVRHALHVLAGRKQDKLTFEAQERIAARFGYGREGVSGAEALMREYHTHAALIARTTDDLLERLTAPPEPTGLIRRIAGRTLRAGVSLIGNQLVADEHIFRTDPLNLIRVFAEGQRHGASLSSMTREAVRRHAELLTEEYVTSPELISLFLAIVRATDGVYRTLAEMNRLGVLGRVVPEFGRLWCLVVRDAYHVYTVDEHSLIGVRELERLREGAFAEQSPLLTQVMRECERHDILFLAMMFHDLGKGYGADHDERGARMVADVARRLGLNIDERKSLEFLVRHHLTMSMLAQNRDIDDPLLVQEFVRTVGTVENLRYLFLLTFADMRAVGPQIWSGWKEHLLSELYTRALEAFETGAVEERDLAARARRARKRLLEQVVGDDERRRLDDFIQQMPVSYVISNPSERIIDHWRLYESLGSGLFRAGVMHDDRRGFSEFTVCTADRPGLFVALTGVLTAHGLDILGAKIVTSARGVVIDTFTVAHDDDSERVRDSRLWQRVREDIARALSGELDVTESLTQLRKRRATTSSVRRARRRTRTSVHIDNQVATDHTVIDVHAADRPGLLFTIAERIHRLGLVIHMAKITTRVEQVLDVFYVTNAAGRKIEDPAEHERIKAEILRAIQEADADEPHLISASGGDDAT